MTDYVCAACQGQFTSDRSQEAAQAEAEFVWDKDYLEQSGSSLICEDCWQLNFDTMMSERMRGELKN